MATRLKIPGVHSSMACAEVPLTVPGAALLGIAGGTALRKWASCCCLNKSFRCAKRTAAVSPPAGTNIFPMFYLTKYAVSCN